MKKLLLLSQLVAMIAVAAPHTIETASLTSDQMESMLQNLVRISARQYELSGLIQLMKSQVPNGVNWKPLINQSILEIQQIQPQIDALKEQLEQAGLPRGAIDYAVEESLVTALMQEAPEL